MEVNFQLSNEEFEDALAVSVNGETKELTTQERPTSFDIPNIDKIEVQVEYKRNDIQQIKNPIGRFFAYLFFFLLSPIIFFADNDNGIGIHKFFYDAKPFDLKKTFKIAPTENVVLKFIPPKYDKATRQFSDPDIEVVGEKTTDEVLYSEYNQASFKKEFRLYHYPAYIGMVAFLLAVIALSIYGLVKQVSHWDWFGVIGLSFCLFAMLALLIAIVTLFVSTQKLFREIDRDLRAKSAESRLLLGTQASVSS